MRCRRGDAEPVPRYRRSKEQGGRPWLSVTTSSSSAPAPAAARSRTRSRRPARRSCCSSGATSCLARARTGSPTRCSSKGRYISEDTWYDADGKAFQPQVHYFVGGATKMYGAALYRLRPQDFGELNARRRRLAGVAARLRRLRALVHQGRVALSGPREPRRGPHGGHVEQAVPVPRRLARAADPAALGRLDRGRVPPVPRAVRDHARTRRIAR